MRLPYNVFLTSALVIVALVGVVTWSLLAISRLVDVNRGIATQSLPALRMDTSLRDQLGGLTWTEMDAKPAVGEPAQKAWNDRAARMAKDFDLLRPFLGSEEERSQHQEAIPVFAIYRRLSIATAQLADGTFTHPLPVTSGDEIGELARSFNRRAERLREVDHLKEEFSSYISHELRTLLTSARKATHLLLERVQGPLTAKQGRLVDIIAASSERLLRLVNQVLDLSRLCARLLPLERNAVDMEKVVVRALEELRPQVEDKGLIVGRATSGSDFALLGIVKGLVEAHGGRIRVESEEGRGSCFLVRLPRDGAPPPVGAAPTGSER